MLLGCVRGLFGINVGNIIWCRSVARSSAHTTFHCESRSRQKTTSSYDEASHLVLSFGVLVLEETSSRATEVSSNHMFRAMFSLDLVREYKILESVDINLINDDPLGLHASA